MTADERIRKLIERAGSPVMVCKNTQKDEHERRRGIYSETRKIIEEQFDDSVILYIRHLVDTIDRMEAALYNVLNERDQLLADLNRITNKHGSCDYCLYKNKSAVECRGCSRENDHWTWRGVPDKEDAHEKDKS